METDKVLSSVQDFIQSYLREQADLSQAHRRLARPFQERFYAPDYLGVLFGFRDMMDQNPERFVSAEISEGVPKAITTHSLEGRDRRYRYHLLKSTSGWQITSKEWECFVCRGTGLKSGNKCHVCDGAGWKDFGTKGKG
jgi:hypothetical protein